MFDARDFDTYFTHGIIGVPSKNGDKWKPRVISRLEEVQSVNDGIYIVSTQDARGRSQGEMRFSPFDKESFKLMPDNMGYINCKGTTVWVKWSLSNRHKKIIEKRNLRTKTSMRDTLRIRLGNSITWSEIFDSLFNPYYMSMDEALNKIYNKEILAGAISPEIAITITRDYDRPVIKHCEYFVGFIDENDKPVLTKDNDQLLQQLEEA